MSLLHVDGFDTYSATADFALQYTSSGNATLSTAGGRFGGGALKYGTAADRLYWPCPSGAETELWVGFAFYIGGSSTSIVDLVEFRKSGATEASIAIDMSSMTINAYRGRRSTLLGSSGAGVMGASAWYWLEFRYLISSTVGVMEAWVNGTQVLTLTGLNNTANAKTSIDTVMLGESEDFRGFPANTVLDDLYILNTAGASPLNGRLGDCRVARVVPTSDATPNDGTPSTGATHYGVVDEAQFNTSDYNTIANTLGLEERFGVSALPSTPDTIYAVSPVSVRWKTDAGNAAAYNGVRSGSSETLGAYTQLSTSTQIKRDIIPLDPATSAAWTASGVSNMKLLYRVA